MSHSVTLPGPFGLGMANLLTLINVMVLPGSVGWRPDPGSGRSLWLAIMARLTMTLGWPRFLRQIASTAVNHTPYPLFAYSAISLHRVGGAIRLYQARLRVHLTGTLKFCSGARVSEPFCFRLLTTLHSGSDQQLLNPI